MYITNNPNTLWFDLGMGDTCTKTSVPMLLCTLYLGIDNYILKKSNFDCWIFAARRNRIASTNIDFVS